MSDHPPPGRELLYWLLLSPDEQSAAIHRLRAAGMSEYGIARATQLSVEMVQRVLASEVQP